MQGEAGFGLTTSYDDVAKGGVVAATVVLIGAAVGWRRLGTTESAGCLGDGVDAVAFRDRSGG